MIEGDFNLHIELGNDAMSSHDDIADALNEVAGRVVSGQEDGAIRDVNGNTVGNWSIS